MRAHNNFLSFLCDFKSPPHLFPRVFFFLIPHAVDVISKSSFYPHMTACHLNSVDFIVSDTQGAVSRSATESINSSDKRRGGMGLVCRGKYGPAGDSEKQVIRAQDESKSYLKQALIALLFTAHPQTDELPKSVIRHPEEVHSQSFSSANAGERGHRVTLPVNQNSVPQEEHK